MRCSAPLQDPIEAAMALILIIDDDDNFCGTMESLVRRMGHDFLAAGTLEQGIRILGEQAVDILLLDVGLPDGNGLEALSQIKEASKSSPEIFIITGLGDPAGAETAITEGVWDYIVKPTSIKETPGQSRPGIEIPAGKTEPAAGRDPGFGPDCRPVRPHAKVF